MNSPSSLLERFRLLCEIDLKIASSPPEEQVRSLRAERETLLGSVPGNYKYLYERIRGQKGSVLASISGQACAGCNMLLPPQLISEVRKRLALQLCPTCKRILDPGKE